MHSQSNTAATHKATAITAPLQLIQCVQCRKQLPIENFGPARRQELHHYIATHPGFKAASTAKIPCIQCTSGQLKTLECSTSVGEKLELIKNAFTQTLPHQTEWMALLERLEGLVGDLHTGEDAYSPNRQEMLNAAMKALHTASEMALSASRPAKYNEGLGFTYEAVSYCWGRQKGTSTMQLDDMPYEAPNSAFEVLRTLRRPDEERFVWIDAICINQVNMEE